MIAVPWLPMISLMLLSHLPHSNAEGIKGQTNSCKISIAKSGDERSLCEKQKINQIMEDRRSICFEKGRLIKLLYQDGAIDSPETRGYGKPKYDFLLSRLVGDIVQIAFRV